MGSPSPCPSCGGLSAFRLRNRTSESGIFQVFIKCSSCPYEKVIRQGDEEIVRLEMDIEGLETKLSRGVAVQEVLARRRERLEQLREANSSSG